jgi:hypothetical protein
MEAAQAPQCVDWGGGGEELVLQTFRKDMRTPLVHAEFTRAIGGTGCLCPCALSGCIRVCCTSLGLAFARACIQAFILRASFDVPTPPPPPPHRPITDAGQNERSVLLRWLNKRSRGKGGEGGGRHTLPVFLCAHLLHCVPLRRAWLCHKEGVGAHKHLPTSTEFELRFFGTREHEQKRGKRPHVRGGEQFLCVCQR